MYDVIIFEIYVYEVIPIFILNISWINYFVLKAELKAKNWASMIYRAIRIKTYAFEITFLALHLIFAHESSRILRKFIVSFKGQLLL